MPDVEIGWRAPITNEEVTRVHHAAFSIDRDEIDDWQRALERYSLGWVTARAADTLIGFINVLTDGIAHAWLQDVIVDPAAQRSGVGTAMVERAATESTAAGLEWLHVDFDDEHTGFYLGACGFTPTAAGLRYLR